MKKSVIATLCGGLLVFIGNIILSAFVSSPPSRAEFDSLESTTNVHIQSIDSRLSKLENGQKVIINHLLRGKE